MRKELIPIEWMPVGIQAHNTALHFGENNELEGMLNRPKVYIQSSLHADEMPGSLVAYHLHKALLKLEQEGRLKAHIVLVPLCNPLGLGQSIDYMHIGRFHLPTAQNFNRLYTVPIKELLIEDLRRQPVSFTENPQENARLVRQRIAHLLAEIKPSTNVHSMHLNLLRLCSDAELVLDLHCDNFSVLHMYTTPRGWEVLSPLAAYLGSECQILSEDSGASSFDEVYSSLWSSLQTLYPEVVFDKDVFVSATVEFRGEYDLHHETAQKDAEGILQFLASRGYIDLANPVPAPALINEPHPLEGLYYVPTPMAGIVVYKVKAGEWVSAGQDIAEIINPVTLESVTVKSDFYGFVFALSGARVAMGERKLVSISCPFDIGNAGLSP